MFAGVPGSRPFEMHLVSGETLLHKPVLACTQGDIMIMEKLMMVLSHSAYSACAKCSTRGEYLGRAVRYACICFLIISCVTFIQQGHVVCVSSLLHCRSNGSSAVILRHCSGVFAAASMQCMVARSGTSLLLQRVSAPLQFHCGDAHAAALLLRCNTAATAHWRRDIGKQ